jgi:hypothetical protein
MIISLLLATVVVPGHSHNDYERSRPLLDALAAHMESIEADVFLVDGNLLVGHEREELVPGRTLESLYLKPLKDRLRELSAIYRTTPLILLIDVKTDAKSTFAAIHQRLADFKLPSWIKPIISGNRDRSAILGDRKPLAQYDGRLTDIQFAGQGIPLISDDWSATFSWDGKGLMPADQLERLRSLVKQVHERRRKLRFWAAPDTEESWKTQLEAGVDLINTDHPVRFQTWFNSITR